MRFLMLTLAATASWVACSASMSLSQESGAKVEVLNEVKDAQPDELLAIAFIKSHHPELAMLLEVLKTTDLTKYNSAIKDVAKVIKRLEGARKRDEKLYELEVAGWKIQSKIDLLLAKGMAKDKSFNESDLKQLVENRIDNQIQRSNREIELIDQRKASLVDTVNKLSSNRQSQVDKQHANMLKRLKGDKTKDRSQEP
jgi:hypothetical protein